MENHFSSMSQLAFLHEKVRRERLSSWDRSGGNHDYEVIEAGEDRLLTGYSGAGCIRHIWMTMSSKSEYFAREIVLRMYWDSEENPSVEAPIGDFFGIGHGIVKNFWSAPLCMSPENGRGFNAFFPMPFNKGFKVMVENQSDCPLNLYFYIDFESYPDPVEKIAYFHAWWNRENPTQSDFPDTLDWDGVLKLKNLTDKDNYLILSAEGQGHYVGCHLDIDCFRPDTIKWYGEGDDMIIIDGENWPPRLHGTGTEDYFNTAYCPTEEFCTPFHGITVNSGDEASKWKGKNSLYRYHILDPIYFEKSIRVSIEHGHANHQGHDCASTAYWYQGEPHKPFPVFPARELRLPRP